jgi:transposase
LHQRTKVQHVQTESVSDASRLLDLDGLAVGRVESDAFGGRVVHVVTADECAAACASCGAFSVSVKGLVCTRPRDIPYGVTRLPLIWHKRRWRCKENLCGRSSFTERVAAVRARSRLTTRLRAELGWEVAEQQRCVSEAAAHYDASWPFVHPAFADHVRVPLAAPRPPVKVLGIDKTRRGKPIWAQDPDAKRWVRACDRWHTGFVDAAGTGGLLGQVEGRTSAVTIAWLNEQPEHWRAGITHVTIDLSASYARAVREACRGRSGR